MTYCKFHSFMGSQNEAHECKECHLKVYPQDTSAVVNNMAINTTEEQSNTYWEITFDKVLITKSLLNGYCELCGDEVSVETVLKVKNFIGNLLDSELSKLEDRNNDLWEDGYSFAKYKIKELIKKNTGEQIYRDGETAFDIVRDIETL